MDNYYLVVLIISLGASHLASGSTNPFSIALCTEGGVKCDHTCRRLGSCLSVSGQFQWEEALNCGSMYCNINTLSCTTTLQDCSPNKDIIGCGTPGNFPDPYNCKNMYKCDSDLQLTNVTDFCSGNHGYDPCTGSCDIVLTNGRCPDVGPLCQRPTQMGGIEANQRMFYHCTSDSDGELHPVMHLCPDGFFDSTLNKCVPSSDPGCFPKV